MLFFAFVEALGTAMEAELREMNYEIRLESQFEGVEPEYVTEEQYLKDVIGAEFSGLSYFAPNNAWPLGGFWANRLKLIKKED